MAFKEMLEDVSVSLIRTNPKLTSNIKLIVDSNYNLFLESFNANEELSKIEYKAVNTTEYNSYEYDISRFYNNGNTPSSISFDVSRLYNDYIVHNDFSKQYETLYEYGAEYINSEFYKESMGLFAPIWLTKNVPNYFVIFRIDEPVATNNKYQTDENYNKKIIENPENFQELFLKNAKLIKTFDLTNNTPIGRYIRNYVNNENFPDAPLTYNPEREGKSYYNGISILNGGFISAAEDVNSVIINKDKTIIENDYFLTSGFERHDMVVANMINLEFLFDDDTTEDFTISRYFGLYVNDIKEGDFTVSSDNMFIDKKNELEQLVNINSNKNIDKSNSEHIIHENSTGIAIYADGNDTNTIYEYDEQLLGINPIDFIPNSNIVNNTNSIYYIKDKMNNFHNLKIGSNYNNGKIKITDTEIDYSLFTGFNDVQASERAYVSDKQGHANIVIELTNNIPLGDKYFISLPKLQNYQIIPDNIIPGDLFEIYTSFMSFTVNAVTSNKEDLLNDIKLEIINQNNEILNNYTLVIKNDSLYMREIEFTGNDIDISVNITGSSILSIDKLSSANIDEFTITANDTIATEIGKSEGLYFNQLGNTKEVAAAMTSAFNSIKNRLFTAVNIENKIVLYSNFAGNRFNSFYLGTNVLMQYSQYTIYAPVDNFNDNWILYNFAGGTINNINKVSINIESFKQFNYNNKYLRANNNIKKSQDLDYTKIDRVTYYVDEPITDINNNIIGFNNFDKLCTIITDDDKEIYMDSLHKIHLYDLYRNDFGRFSFYPIKNLDSDFYSQYYSNKKELLIETDYYSDFGTTSSDFTHEDISDFFLNNKFGSIVKILNGESPDTIEESELLCEYDRLNENSIKELTIPSRITPFINKWVLNNGYDIRLNDYRLTSSEAFGIYNYSPSIFNFDRNTHDFTHEWYFLSKLPPYYGLYSEEDLNLNISHFNENLKIKDGLYNNDLDYFKSYFIVDNLIHPKLQNSYSLYDELDNALYDINNNIPINRQLRYSRFNEGTSIGYANTLFKGINVIIKERIENDNYINYNLNNIKTKFSNKYNNYKFSVIMVPLDEDSKYEGINKQNIDIDIIENEKYKNITIVIYLNFNDTINFNNKYLDRTILYALNSKYNYIDYNEVPTSESIEDLSDILLSGALDISVNGNGQYYSNTDTWVFNMINDNNDNIPILIDEINQNKDGSYNLLTANVAIWNEIFKPVSIISNNKIEVKSLSGWNQIADLLPTTAGFISQGVYTYKDGGYNIWKKRLTDISFAEIANKINRGDPLINYITINKEGLIENNKFILELQGGIEILKPHYIKSEIDNNKPVVFNMKGIIGYELGFEDTAIIQPLIRQIGYFKPKFTDIVNFKDNYVKTPNINTLIDFNLIDSNYIDYDIVNKYLGNLSVSNTTGILYQIKDKLKYLNTEFFIDDDFGKINNYYFHKVNEYNNNILELTINDSYQPVYPLISEIAIDKKDRYLFTSNWDSGYYTRNLDKLNTIDVVGTRSIEEHKSFFGSKIIKILDKLVIDVFDNIEVNSYEELINYNNQIYQDDNLFTIVYFNDIDNIYIDVYLNKQIINYISDKWLFEYFNKYIKPDFGYGNQTHINDDINNYIKVNILPRYIRNKIILYIKKSSSENFNNIYPIINSNIEDYEKNQLGYTKDDNYRLIDFDNTNDFNIRIIKNKEPGYYYSLAPSIEIIKK